MSLRIQQIDCRCETKTKDNVFVDINITVQYQIERENLYDAFYKLTDSRWVVGLLLLRIRFIIKYILRLIIRKSC